MAKALLKAGDRAEALAVFAKADQPGPHNDFLRRRCHALGGEGPS